VAERLGCEDDLQGVNKILARGTSATRQREVFWKTHDLSQVVDAMAEEMKSGAPVPLPDSDLVGGTVVRGDPLQGE
jgi:gamma-glutamyl:cysteine ligase YbdK (ATP-grasp superfamily)